MSTFIVEFPLKVEVYQEHIINKRFEIGRKIYNSLLNVTYKRYRELIKTKIYRGLINKLADDKDLNKDIWNQINNLRKQYGLTEYSFHNDVKKMQKHFSKNINSHVAQKIASQLWRAYESLFFGNGNNLHYKKYGNLNMLEGKNNNTGIRFKSNILYWNGLSIPVIVDYSNPYEVQAMQNDIAYCKVVRKYIRHKYKYYVQIVFKGTPPVKINKNTGEIKHSLGIGDVGIDIGISTIAYSSATDVKIIELADKVQNIEKEKRLILRKLDRSRRMTNPNNYNKNGTIKTGRLKWRKSKRYMKNIYILKELQRKQKDIRKYQHECLANMIIALGDTFYVETMRFQGLAKKAKNTEKNKNGKFKRRKRFGKSIGNRAPAMLLTIIDRKLGYYNKELTRINTKEAKASQFNHFDGTYKKKALSQRWNNINGYKIQRDMYSAFLIMNICPDLKTVNIDKCNKQFENFYRLHNIEVGRLTNNNNLKSIGI